MTSRVGQLPRQAGAASLWLKALYLLLGTAAAGTLAFAIFQPIKVLPRITLAPGLALVDQAGQRFTSESLRGQIVLYNFAFAQCAAPCAARQAALREVQTQLDGLDTGGLPVRLVTLSVDPAHDTPAVLAEWAAREGADPQRWRFATGDPALLKAAVGAGFQLYYGPAADGQLQVDPLLVLVDGWGILRAEYRTATPDVSRLLRDIQLVVTEARQSTGVGRYAYEAAHLFLCYAR